MCVCVRARVREERARVKVRGRREERARVRVGGRGGVRGTEWGVRGREGWTAREILHDERERRGERGRETVQEKFRTRKREGEEGEGGGGWMDGRMDGGREQGQGGREDRE